MLSVLAANSCTVRTIGGSLKGLKAGLHAYISSCSTLAVTAENTCPHPFLCPYQLPCLLLQLPHRRAANTTWKLKSAGLFGKGKVLVVEATRTVRQGEALVMDYGQDKLDNAVLLDHGTLDTTSPKVATAELASVLAESVREPVCWYPPLLQQKNS